MSKQNKTLFYPWKGTWTAHTYSVFDLKPKCLCASLGFRFNQVMLIQISHYSWLIFASVEINAFHETLPSFFEMLRNVTEGNRMMSRWSSFLYRAALLFTPHDAGRHCSSGRDSDYKLPGGQKPGTEKTCEVTPSRQWNKAAQGLQISTPGWNVAPLKTPLLRSP